MITAVILLVCLFTMLSMSCKQQNKNIKIVAQEFIKDQRSYIIDNPNKSLIIDTELYDADYIDCTFKFYDQEYKILVSDYYDLSELEDGSDVQNTVYDIVRAELYKDKSPFTNDVTQKLRQYSGPNKDFYGKDIRTLDFKTIFAFVKTAPDNWLLRVHLSNGNIDIIHV